MDLLQPSEKGYYCEPGGFYVDPEQRVVCAVISHGHADHGAVGGETVYASHRTRAVLEARYDTAATGKQFREPFTVNGVEVTFFPANHVFGSSLVRLRYDEETWLYTGDYKAARDGTATALEVVETDVLVTETTFALPIYTWDAGETVADRMAHWCQECIGRGETPVLVAYSLGKAQRVLNALKGQGLGDIKVHRSVAAMNEVYESAGVDLGEWSKADFCGSTWKDSVVVMPQGALETKKVQRYKEKRVAMVSGWMQVRGNKRWKGFDQGFVLSDHCDWEALSDYVDKCGASRVCTVHGYTEAYARYLREEKGLDAEAWE